MHRMAVRSLSGSLACLCLAASSAFGQGLPAALRPEDVGLSSIRLARLRSRMTVGVHVGELSGAVVLIARRGRVAYFESFGLANPQTKTPMRRDALFRLSSLTEPFTSLAIMMLAERGLLSIAEPVTRYLPEFKNVTVGNWVAGVDGKGKVVREPLRREMTVQDLLRHTSGLTYGAEGAGPLKQAYVDAKVDDPNQSLAEMVSKLSKLALLYQPGTTWEYGMNADVLGRIVEVVSGMSLESFMAEQIAKPLALVDTGFSAPTDKADRGTWPEGEHDQAAEAWSVTAAPKYKSGGVGMVSSVPDYARFCQFWLNGGELDGVRLVSRKTVELMTSNHLPPGTEMGPDMYGKFRALLPSPELGQGFGLGFLVRMEPGLSPLPGSVGDISWAGSTGTYFWIDPQDQLVVVLMMPSRSPSTRFTYRSLLRELAYQALLD